MSDLIDRAALMKEIQKIGGNPWSEWETAGVVNLVCGQSAVDAVPVVRCKDCEYYDFDDGYCGYTDGFNNKEHFCSYGKRRTNATD